MKLHFLANGKTYNWNIFTSVLDFFFPYRKNGEYEYIRAEASACMEDGKIVYSFYTFRAFFFHYFYQFLIFPLKELNFFWNLSLASQLGAIGFDTSVDGSNTSAANNLTWTHVITGSNTLLTILGVGDLLSGSASDNLTSATYNSVGTTNIASVTPPVAASRWLDMWFLLAPAGGSHSVVINASTTTKLILGLSASYSGVKQSGQPDASNTNTVASNTTLSTSVTVVLANCWLIMAMTDNNGVTMTAGSGTRRQGDSSNGTAIFDSNAVVGTGSQSLSASWSGNNPAQAILASFAPAPATSMLTTHSKFWGAA